MKKLLILLILVFTLVGCQANRNVDGYVKVKTITHDGNIIYYFDQSDYDWYDYTYENLYEAGLYYIYVKIDTIPFYELANKKEVMIYGTGKNAYEIFVKASDIHTIKIEV